MEERLAFQASSIEEVIQKLEAYENQDYGQIYLGNAKKENCGFLLEGEAGEAYMDIVISKKQYQLLAQLWVKGIAFDWSFLYGTATPNKIFLPTYPFAKQFYWVSKSETETKHVEELTTNVDEKTVVRQFSIEEKVESYIMALVKKVLKLDEKDIDFSAEIADYGIDSIMSSIMISDLKELVPDVPPLLFLEQNTFNDVVSYLIEDFSDCFQEIQPKEKVVQKKITEEKKEVTEVKVSQIEKLPEVTSNETPSNKSMDLAIVGISSLLPNTTSIQNFFNHMENGTSLVEVFPERRKELLNLTDEENKLLKDFYGAFIDDVENFDYTRFKFSKEEAVQIDPQLRKLIESVWNAIGDSGYSVKEFNKQETGVYVATRGNSGYAEVMQKNDLNYEVESPTLYANRLSHVFNLKGPSEVVDTACSSFIAAIQRARHAFERGDCKQAIVATATLNLSSKELTQEDLTGIYSKSGNTKSFSEDSDGFVRSEAIGTIVVKPLEEAKTAGDYIYGVIKGVGVYHGGKSPLKWNSPNIKGQKKAIEKALESAMINPTTIDYVEAEANGVSFVDTSEMVSIQNVYGNYLKNSDNATDKKIYIGSSKPLMGHAEASSTFPCLLKLLASFQKEKLFGVNGLTEINKGITVDANFEILKEDIQWKQPSDLPRRAAMNCLGIGGVNTHLILESYDNASSNYNKENNFVFVFSDVNEEQLATQLKNVSSSIKDLETTMSEVEILNRIEYTLQQGRTTEKCRLAFIASSLSDMKNHIDNWLSDKESWSNEINRFYGANFAKPTSEQLADSIQAKDWKLLAEYWVSGATVSWQKTCENSSLKRFPIPTTSLRKTSCWPHEISEISTLERGNSSEYTPLYTRIEGQNSSPYTLDKDHLFLFDLQWKAEFSEDSGSNSELEKHTILAYLDAEIPENYSGKKLGKPTDFTEQTFTELVNTSFLYIKDLIKQKPKKEVAVQIVLPKSCIHNSYGLTGLVHTSRQESTKIKTQLIFIEDLSDKEELVSILNENTNCLQDRVIKYENGVRYVEYAVPKHVLTNPINTEITYKEDDVILVTGGLGGLGITCAEDIIANSSKATIILVGRSPLNEEKQTKLNKLNSGNHKVVYLPTDISNETQVSELIEKIIVDYKKLDGIIHCAGVIRDSYIMKKTVEEIKDVFEPKVYGAKYLDTHTKDIELRFFLCFSSLHSLGNPGQSDYAMSNAYVDGFVRERNLLVAKGERFGFSIAMNWPYWKSGGMQLSELAIDLMTMTKGSIPMPNEIGMEIMHYALQNNIEQLFVDMGIFDKIVKQHNIQLKELSMEIS
jgi:polyketide synthase PksL